MLPSQSPQKKMIKSGSKKANLPWFFGAQGAQLGRRCSCNNGFCSSPNYREKVSERHTRKTKKTLERWSGNFIEGSKKNPVLGRFVSLPKFRALFSSCRFRLRRDPKTCVRVPASKPPICCTFFLASINIALFFFMVGDSRYKKSPAL